MKRVIILLAAAALVLGVKFMTQYWGFYAPEPPEPYRLENLTVPVYEPAPYEDVYNVTAGGVALIDMAHKNSFSLDELNVLLTRVVARNYTLKYLTDTGEMNKSLRSASTFIVISPGEKYTEKEADMVEEFLRDNGTLILMDDPSRSSQINILSLRFGIVFNRDYIYNTFKNEGNYRYVIFEEFGEANVSRGLEKVVLYVAESVSGDVREIFLPDENTVSSHGGRAPSPVVEKGRILAIGDITFLTPRYYSFFDNNRFISNLADYITSSPRKVPPAKLEEEGEKKKPEVNQTT
jgi:hypothetical protein